MEIYFKTLFFRLLEHNQFTWTKPQIWVVGPRSFFYIFKINQNYNIHGVYLLEKPNICIFSWKIVWDIMSSHMDISLIPFFTIHIDLKSVWTFLFPKSIKYWYCTIWQKWTFNNLLFNIKFNCWKLAQNCFWSNEFIFKDEVYISLQKV